MSDLLTKLGSKSTAAAEGAGSPEPRQTQGTSDGLGGLKGNNIGKDLIKSADSKSETAATGQTKTAGVSETEPNDTSNKDEPSGSDVSDPNTWTLDSAFKEIKKLREENKSRRQKYEESVEKLKQDMEARMSTYLKEIEEAKKAKEELEEIKTKDLDRKRSLEEKLSHRESLIAEMKIKLDNTEKSYQERIQQMQSQVEAYKAEQLAEQEVYKKRLESELATIPEKFRGVADLIVKGAGDARDALLAINEAKVKGVFDDKTIVVNHSVPGAKQGARTTKEALDEAAKAERAKMNSSQKIAEALKQIKSGETNTAFRRN